MAKRDMKKALGASIRAEEDAVKNRFERAETALGRSRPEALPNVEDGGRPKADRVIRDSFTMPVADHECISRIKKRARKLDFDTNKSEVLRAGLSVLEKMSDKELLKVFELLPKVKPGRPSTKLAQG